MGTFLQILGALVLALIIVLVVAVFLIRFYLRRAVSAFTEGLGKDLVNLPQGSGVAPRIHMVAESGPAWQDTAAADRCVQALKSLGFQDMGHYAVQEIPDLHLQGWTKPEEFLYSIVYEKPRVGVWMDYVTYYEGGGSITVTNSPSGHQLEHRPGHDKVYDAGLDPTTLYHRMMQERKPGPYDTVTADTFVARFEKAYADEMDWRNSRGGATEEEIRRIAASSGTEVSDETVAAMRRRNVLRACAALEVALRERLVESTPMSAAEWERLRSHTVFVHDQLTPDMVAALFEGDLFDEEGDEIFDQPDEDEGRTVPEGVAPREAFRLMNLDLPPEDRLEKIGELNEPVAADVYRRPATT